MKYHQLVSMPSSVSDWLEEQLEVNGIDAVVYTRYLLSILYNATVDVIGYDEDLQHSQSKKEVGQTIGGDRHLHHWHSEWWRYADIDVEQLKRSSAVRCLLSASDQIDAIESLIDELCDKLKAEPAESIEPLLPSPVAYFSQELVQQYYSAFPSLQTPSWTKFSEKEGQESTAGYKMDAFNKLFANKESIEMGQEPVHSARIIRPTVDSADVPNLVDLLSQFMSSVNPSEDYSDKKSFTDFDLELVLNLIPPDAKHTPSPCFHCLQMVVHWLLTYKYSPRYCFSRNQSTYRHQTAKPSHMENEAHNEHTKSIVKDVLNFIDISDEAPEKNYTRHEDRKYKHKNHAPRDEYKNCAFRYEHKNDTLRKEKHVFSPRSKLPLGYVYSIWAERNKPYTSVYRDGEHKDALKSKKCDLFSVFNPVVGSDPRSIWADENEIRKKDYSKHGKHKNDAHMSEKHFFSNYNPLSDRELHPVFAARRGKPRNNAPSCECINRDGEYNDGCKSEKRDLFSVFNPVVGSNSRSIWADENEIRKKDNSEHGKHKNDAHMSGKHPFSKYNPLSDRELHPVFAAPRGKLRNNAPSCECINRDGECNDGCKRRDLFSVFNPVVGSNSRFIWADENEIRKKDDNSEHGKHKNDAHMSEKHLFSKYKPLSDGKLLMLAALKKRIKNHPWNNEHLVGTYDDGKWSDYFLSASSAASLENDKGTDYKSMSSRLGDLCSNNSEHNVFRSWWEGFQDRRKIKNTDRAYDVISLSHSLFKLNHDDEGPFTIVNLSNSPRTEHENGSSTSAKTATSMKSALDRSNYKFLESLDTNFIPIEVQEKRDRENEIDISESDESSGDEQTDGGYPRGSSLSIKVPPELLKSFISKSKFYSSNKCCQAEVEDHVVLMMCTTDDAEDSTEEFVETTTSFSQEQREESFEYRNCEDWSMWGTGRSNLFSEKEAAEDARENGEEDLEWDNNTLRNLWNVENLMANSQARAFCSDRVRRNLFWEREIEPQDHDSDWQELSCALDRERTKFQLESPIEGLRMYQLFGPSSKRNMKILKESTCLPASSSFFEENCITQMPTLHTVTL